MSRYLSYHFVTISLTNTGHTLINHMAEPKACHQPSLQDTVYYKEHRALQACIWTLPNRQLTIRKVTIALMTEQF